MLAKQRTISILAFVALSSLILCYPASSQDTPARFTLQLLHTADLEGGVEALDNAPRFSSVLNALKAEEENTVIIGAGDTYIPGAFFAAGNDPSLRDVLGREGSGRADILILNAMGFMASALGNHEFDLGTGTLASLIADDGRGYVGTAFPFLSANLDFSLDRNLAPLVVNAGQEAGSIPNSIGKSAVITTASGEKIGVVGATTPWLPKISIPGDVAVSPENRNDIPALAAIIQESVDELKSTGVEVIILAGHLQRFSIDEALAAQLHSVDIIISGGSNTLLADNTDRLRDGDTADGDYPILATSSAGEPLAIVSTDGDYKYVGRLVVDFDEASVLIPESIDANVSGVFATDEAGVVNTGNAAPVPQVVAITEAIRDVVLAKDGVTFGSTSVYLEGRRGSVRTEETNLGNLTADANLYAARRFDPTVVASLKNGGGIRASIGVIVGVRELPPPANPLVGKAEGQISQLDIENTSRFNNGLSLLTLTAPQLLEVVEHAVAEAQPGVSTGQFPQVGGLAFSYDMSGPAGGRVKSLVITDSDGNPTDIVAQNGEVVGDVGRTFRIVTLDFLADGGDDYPYPNYSDTNRVDLSDVMTEEQSGGRADFAAPGREQDAFAEYLAANFTGTPYSISDADAENDERIQNLALREDSPALSSSAANTFETRLAAGLNMISLPLMPNEPHTARSFMETLGATTVIEYNASAGKFIGFTANSPGNGFPIEGGKGYIVNVTEPKVASFTGRAWQNAPAMASPASRQVSTVWAFVLHARLEGLDGISLTVHNGRTGEIEVIEAGKSHAVWADMNRQTVAAVGDVLIIEVYDAGGELIRTLHHEIDAVDMRRAFAELRLTPDDMIPRTTALLPNYPNPFNPETWMPYQLAIDTHAAIRIYTPSGTLIRTFELGFRDAGFYVGKSRAAYWDGFNNDGERVASGTYFYQLITPESTATRKMVILK